MRDKELINDMIVPLLHQWTKANALFKPPVINQCRTIELKLTKLWHKAVETSLGKGNLARKNEFLHTLDTLFDILTCKCSIQLCSESNCSHSGKRENNSHIDCGCPREKKIPVLELEFIKAQRTKAEGQGSMQMGSIDYSETKKQIANAKKREQIREREQKKKMKSEEAIQREEELCQDVYHFFDIPPINVNATKLSELVDLSLEVLEPPLTTSLTSQELRNLKETPMQVPKWPSHTQSVERCVKMVTEAAGHVYSHERREVMLSTDLKVYPSPPDPRNNHTTFCPFAARSPAGKILLRLTPPPHASFRHTLQEFLTGLKTAGKKKFPTRTKTCHLCNNHFHNKQIIDLMKHPCCPDTNCRLNTLTGNTANTMPTQLNTAYTTQHSPHNTTQPTQHSQHNTTQPTQHSQHNTTQPTQHSQHNTTRPTQHKPQKKAHNTVIPGGLTLSYTR
ncbi:hypothetical protein Hamer_G017985 [Homarus americanus]|uniref:Uncharacterized protein n=1 Tax=Homarus americanus TaxID=6706 RepID=A0A8J5N553_HOMAM|nr:hypothetical protein Hamer_G017985 [Homarus americanus]